MADNNYRASRPGWFDEHGNVLVDILRELIDYNPETGEMRWKLRQEKFFFEARDRWGGIKAAASQAKTWNRQFAGGITGSVSVSKTAGRPHIKIVVLGIKFTGAAIAHALAFGYYRDGNTITVDGDMTNLKAANLEAASAATARAARHIELSFFKSGGTSKYAGVHKQGNRWTARIRVKKKEIYLGHFKIEEDAADAYDRAALKHFGPSAMTNDAVRPELRSSEPKASPKRKVNTEKTAADDI